MSDRVDEQRREEQRIEAQRLQRQQDTKRQTEVKESFAKVVKNIQETKGKEQAKEQTRQDRSARSVVTLAAKRGIANREQARAVAQSSSARGQRQRREAIRQAETHNAETVAQADETLARSLRKQNDKPSAHDHAGRDASAKDPGADPRTKERGDDPRTTERQAQEVVAQSGQMATAQAITGVSPREASASSAGLHTDIQQIINELVDAVYKGVDKNNFGFMHIELKSHILSGSSLSLQSTHEGIHLKVQTDDDEVARLLSSGATAGELSRALDGKGVKLASFEVNQDRVLG